jgi:hypothetical protein
LATKDSLTISENEDLAYSTMMAFAATHMRSVAICNVPNVLAVYASCTAVNDALSRFGKIDESQDRCASEELPIV